MKVTSKIPQLVANLKGIVGTGVAAAGEYAADAMVRAVGSENNPSLPGQYPGNRMGGAGLRGSIKDRPNQDGSCTILSEIEYLRYLEFGTMNQDGSVKMLPRPLVRRTMTEKRAEINEAFTKECRRRIKAVLKGAGS